MSPVTGCEPYGPVSAEERSPAEAGWYREVMFAPDHFWSGALFVRCQEGEWDMLEKMGAFFDRRLEGYEDHQLTAIDSAGEFYPFTARCLPQRPEAEILDLGCGTGLELSYYFPLNPTAHVTGIDLAEGMLSALEKKFSDKALRLIRGSYFDVPFERGRYDAAVSVESLHHFTREEKIPLYRKVYEALEENGFFILTDYFALSEEEEVLHRQELRRLMEREGAQAGELYHYDTPLTVEHEIEALHAAGFDRVEILGRWGPTCTLRSDKGPGG